MRTRKAEQKRRAKILLAHGLPQKQVALLEEVTEKTVSVWAKEFKKEREEIEIQKAAEVLKKKDLIASIRELTTEMNTLKSKLTALTKQIENEY